MVLRKLDPTEIVETIRDGLIVLTPDHKVEFANRSFLKMFDVTSEETLGRSIYDLGNGQWDIPELKTLLEEILPCNEAIEAYTVEHTFEDIGRKIMRLNARKTVRPGNGSTRILVAIADVTKAENAKRSADREKRLARGIVDTVREPLLVLDGDQRVIAASRSFYRTFAVDEDATVGRRLNALGNGQWDLPELTGLLDDVIPDGTTIEGYTVTLDAPNVGQRTMLLNARKIYREGNNTKTLLLAIEDVTERTRLEAERNASMAQATMLLEELNHRVMNNLAVVNSIIGLESRDLADEECRQAFERMSARIQSIATLYRKLTTLRSTDTVSADEYLSSISRELAKSLFAGRGHSVAVRHSIAPVKLSTRVAVPLGLMLNELLTNAAKYAFDDDQNGEIFVKLSETDGSIEFTIADDGKGIDEGQRIDSGVGSRLVAGFAQQLGGKLERTDNNPGTKYSLVFSER